MGNPAGRPPRSRLPSGKERAQLVREMFDRIAGRYELMNTLMTAGLHRLWNRKVLKATGLQPGGRALDLACGTGTSLATSQKKVGPEGYVLGVDFSEEMLHVAHASGAQRRVPARGRDRPRGRAFRRLRRGHDSLRSEEHPRPRRTLLRDGAYAQAGRGRGVPGDCAADGQGTPPRSTGCGSIRSFRELGGLISGDPSAYSYLPESVKEFVAPGELADIIERNGLQNVTWERVAGGIITLHRGIRPHDAG